MKKFLLKTIEIIYIGIAYVGVTHK